MVSALGFQQGVSVACKPARNRGSYRSDGEAAGSSVTREQAQSRRLEPRNHAGTIQGGSVGGTIAAGLGLLEQPGGGGVATASSSPLRGAPGHGEAVTTPADGRCRRQTESGSLRARWSGHDRVSPG